MRVDKLSYVYNNCLFPQNWKKYKLSQLLEVVERPVDMVGDQEYDLITIKRNFGGIESRGKLTGQKILVKSQFKIHEGDFIISKRQIVHGACAIVPKKYEGAIVSNEYDVMNCKNNLLPSFFNYLVQLPFMRRYFYIASDGVHIEKLRFKTDDWLRQRIHVPSIVEQQNIASILTTSDKAIQLKEQLIVEKKQQKKWLMQNLLTGKKRIPGFTDEWKEVQFQDVFTFEGGFSASRNELLLDEGICYLHYGDIHKSNKTYINVKDQYISIPKLMISVNELNSNYFLYDGDVVFVDASEDHEGTCKYIVVKNKENIPFIAGLHTIIARSINDLISGNFKQYCFSTFNVKRQFAICANGISVYGISKSSIAKISFLLPPLPEQTAIAEILSAADKEIDLHEKQLEELKKQKKALMQLLLTGIVRVNTQEES